MIKMDDNTLKKLGFTQEVERRQANQCPLCGSLITSENMKQFRNPLSIKEFYQSGMCQECQDGIFK